MNMSPSLIVFDFGSQYTQLIARRVRELGYYAEIKPYDLSFVEFKKKPHKAVIFSGGPASIYEPNAPKPSSQVVEWVIKNHIPLLGICYGMQLIVDFFGGSVEASSNREFGQTELTITSKESPLTMGMSNKTTVWMSHGDRVKIFPNEFCSTGETRDREVAIIIHRKKPIYALQFHPEVYHTTEGIQLLKNFCELSGVSKEWTVQKYSQEIIHQLKKTVGPHRVLLGVSGGVDSIVTAKLLAEAIGDQLTCVYVDNGLMRMGETKEVSDSFERVVNLPLHVVRAESIFLQRLKNVVEPEEKRKIIGRTFIDEFKKKIVELGEHKFLSQGTLYPDVIESISTKGPSDLIKSHHNRVKEVLDLLEEGRVLEPLKELFKDEVRKLGQELKIPDDILFRHPFPGPGLSIRILGEISSKKLDTLRKVDHIFIHELKKYGYYDDVWQAFSVLLPVKSVGVMGDKRTYQNVVAIRAVESQDGMTADFAKLPFEFLSHVSTKIINEVSGVNRVVYDISSKPPSTIEWE